MKLYISAPFSAENRELILNAAQGCELAQTADDADILVGLPPKNARLTHVKFVQSPNAGTEGLLSALPQGAVAAGTSGAFGTVIAEYAAAGILALYRRLPDYRALQRAHRWEKLGGGRMISGCTALILGCGDIGGAVAKRLGAFGAKVLGVRRSPRPAQGFDEVYSVQTLDGLLPRADIVVCCLPHTAQTAGLLDGARLELLKPSAVLVNVGRGSVLDEGKLAQMLAEKRLYGAVLDVFESEPLPPASPLWELDNVILTPHISGRTFGEFPAVERACAEICADNVGRFLRGEPLINAVGGSDE